MNEQAPEVFDALLRRTVELHEALTKQLERASFDDSAHVDLTLSAAELALEHGISIAVLVETGHLSSANVLLRAQLEATIRAAWFLYVASDDWIQRYLDNATSNPSKDPGCAPSVDEMIRAIEKRAVEGMAHPAVAPQLKVLKDGAWASLNSFVHSGIHPTILKLQGYPLDSAGGTLRNSNGLCVVTAMLIALLSGDADICAGIQGLQRQFLDCGPPLMSH